MNEKQKYEQYLRMHLELIKEGWEQIKEQMDNRIKMHDLDKFENIERYVEARENGNYLWEAEPLLSHSKNRHHFLLNEIIEKNEYNILDLIESILDIKSAAFGKNNTNSPDRRWMEEQKKFRNIEVSDLKIVSLYENSFEIIELKNK